MNSTLRVAMAGAGFASELHLAGWKRVPNAEVVAICDPGEGKAATRARQFGIASVFREAGAMLDEVRPDAIDIAAPMHEHVPLCLLAASQRRSHPVSKTARSEPCRGARVWRAQSTARCG